MSQNQLPGLRRTLALLEHLACHRSGAQFSELEAVCPDANAASLSRLLAVLREEELVVKNERAYVLGPRAARLGALLGENPPVAERVRPCVERLAHETGESAAFFEFTGAGMQLTAKTESAEVFHYMPLLGINTNFGHHGFAKVALAYQDQATRDRLLADLKRPLPMPRAELDAELAAILREEFILNRCDDRPGVVRLAAPVFQGAERSLAGVIGLSRYDVAGGGRSDAELSQAVRRVAQQASARLGAPAERI